jgi:hypothetical protein
VRQRKDRWGGRTTGYPRDEHLLNLLFGRMSGWLLVEARDLNRFLALRSIQPDVDGIQMEDRHQDLRDAFSNPIPRFPAPDRGKRCHRSQVTQIPAKLLGSGRTCAGVRHSAHGFGRALRDERGGSAVLPFLEFLEQVVGRNVEGVLMQHAADDSDRVSAQHVDD